MYPDIISIRGVIMSTYIIQPYTIERAKRLGVRVRPSANPKKKVDVLDLKGNVLAAIGDVAYSDYPTYLATKGKAYADERRRLYLIRHKRDSSVVGTPGFWATRLLW